MNNSHDAIDFKGRVALYRQYDQARQEELEDIAERYDSMRHKLDTLEADLEDEKETRQSWRKRAQLAENAITRSQFILVLVDGDGYIFKDEFLREAHESGGAMAAHRLATEVQDYLRDRNIVDHSSPDVQVMVNIYANRTGLARRLLDADLLQFPSSLDQFFCSFVQNQPLFQFIDCGYGKERADAKLRDTFRFYAYNVHCKHIFLACCHDNGYVAELDKYRHDPIAAPKTILVDSAQMGRGYSTLSLPIARLNVFNTQPLPAVKKEAAAPTMSKSTTSMPAAPSTSADDAASQISVEAPSTSGQSVWSTQANHTSFGASKKMSKLVGTSTSPPPQTHVSESSSSTAGKIPVNRAGQRIDLKITIPTNQDLDVFEDRIATRKLCNRHHLANDCPATNCRFDHSPIDAKLKNTLRYKARSIPCANGPQCREAGCFYGHQCPWGKDKCSNLKCTFWQKGMHNINDTEIAKHVSAEVYY